MNYTAILTSLMVIGVVGSAMSAGTMAYFSDTETSTGNTFTAGVIDLKVDYDGYYNKEPDRQPNAGHWELKDLTQEERFFNLPDIKPGDFGEGTISLHGYSNDAYAKMKIIPRANDDVSSTEPELEAGDAQEVANDAWDGELAQNMNLVIWHDDGDNILEESENTSTGIIYDGKMPLPQDTIPVEMLQLDLGTLPASTTKYIGVKWNVPTTVGNIIQSDKYVADVSFEIEQTRHNP